MGQPNAANEENRDPGQDFPLPCVLDINMPIRERSAQILHQVGADWGGRTVRFRVEIA